MKGNFAGGNQNPDPGPVGREPVGVMISAPNSNGVCFTGDAGKTDDIESSVDLQNWDVIETGLQGEINFEDADAGRLGNRSGYYRGTER